MFVKQLIGRQAGEIVEMEFAEAKVCLDAGTAQRVSDEEIEAASHQPAASRVNHTDEQLLAGYRIDPAPDNSGYDAFDAGGVPLNKDFTYRNFPQARDAVLAHSRAARGLPPAGETVTTTDKSEGEAEAGYSKMRQADLKAECEKRGIDAADAKKNADYVALLERDDVVTAAVASKDWDVLTEDEMKAKAEALSVDLAAATNKDEMVAVYQAAHPKA